MRGLVGRRIGGEEEEESRGRVVCQLSHLYNGLMGVRRRVDSNEVGCGDDDNGES